MWKSCDNNKKKQHHTNMKRWWFIDGALSKHHEKWWWVAMITMRYFCVQKFGMIVVCVVMKWGQSWVVAWRIFVENDEISIKTKYNWKQGRKVNKRQEIWLVERGKSTMHVGKLNSRNKLKAQRRGKAICMKIWKLFQHFTRCYKAHKEGEAEVNELIEMHNITTNEWTSANNAVKKLAKIQWGLSRKLGQ